MKEQQQYRYASTSIALDELEKKGFTVDYNINEKDILDNPEGFDILYIYRYEGESDPDDESTVYGIEKKGSNVRGVFVVGNLAMGEDGAGKLLRNLEIKGKKNL